MPTENQRAMRRVFNKTQDPDHEEHSKQFGMTSDELCVEIDGHKARPKPVVKKDKASLYQGNESIYDAYHEALSKKFHRDLLAEFQNSNLAVCELFDTGKGNESTRTRERSVDRRSLRLSVMGGASRRDTKTSADGEPLTPSKAGGSTTGTSIRDRANSKSSGDSDGFSANEEDQKPSLDPKKAGEGQRGRGDVKTGDKALKSKRDPRRLVPIKVEDRSQVQGSAGKAKATGQSKEPTTSRAKASASAMIENAERERELKRRQMNARRDEKIRQLRGEKEFGIETDQKLKEEIQRDVQKELNSGKRGKPIVKEGVRVKQNEDGIDPDGGLEIPDVVFREIDSDEEERIAQRKFARMHGDDDEGSERDDPPQRRDRPAAHSDDSSDSAPKPLGRGNARGKPNRRSASKDSHDSESVEYSRSSLRQSSKHNHNYHAGPELSYDEEAIDGDLDDEEEDPDLVGVTDKRLREDIIAYKQKLVDATEEEKKLDGSLSITKSTDRSSGESVL